MKHIVYQTSGTCSQQKVKERLGGIRCGYKNTSCPDQLVRALEQAE